MEKSRSEICRNIRWNYNYEGEKDENGTISGIGVYRWTSNTEEQKYQGDFFRNTLHGLGCFKHDESIEYQGHFFANNFEGYARVKYSTGHIFEGLFKENIRYGPGIFTYPLGLADVGFWCGEGLSRLTCVPQLDIVPKLITTIEGLKVLQKYRKIVNISRPCDKAEEILTELKANINVMNRKSELYNESVKNRDSLFFDHQKYEDDFTSGPKKYKNHVSYYLNTHCDKLYNYPEEIQEEENESNQIICKLYKEDELKEEISRQIRAVDNLMNCICILITKLSNSNDLEPKEEDEIEDCKILYVKENIDFDLKEFSFQKYYCLGESLRDIETELQGEGMTYLANNIRRSYKHVNDHSQRLRRIVELSEQIKLSLKQKFEQLNNLNQKNDQKVSESLLPIGNIWSWNNEENMIGMMRHCYLHKQEENMLTLNISDVIFGNRSKLGLSGPHENDCLCFLTSCATGNCSIIKKLMKNIINPNVSDCRSNTGVFYAAAMDRINVLEELVQLGADLDVYNDDCLTPLSLSICRYLAFLFNVSDWEKAFMDFNEKEENLGKSEEWRKIPPRNYFNSEKTINQVFASVLPSSNKDLVNFELDNYSSETVFEKKQKLKQAPLFINFTSKSTEKLQSYIFNLNFITPTHMMKSNSMKSGRGNKKLKKDKKNTKNFEKTDRSKSKKSVKRENRPKSSSKSNTRNSKSGKSENRRRSSSKNKEEIENILKNNITDTIMKLLNLGANPDYGEVPLPPLILGIFTKDASIITEMMKRANPNIQTRINNLTPIHVICCLPFENNNLNILEIIIPNSDLNLRTGNKHWKEENGYILAKNHNLKIKEGKTCLHILSIRNDYINSENIQCKMFNMLAANGANPDLLYLGHTSLTLAMLRGNKTLVEGILKGGYCNPNEILGESMGIPLTVLLLKRYENYHPVDLCMQLIDLLVKYGANPLVKIGEIGNSIEFLEQEHRKTSPVSSVINKKHRYSKQTKDRGKKRYLIEYLLHTARKILVKHIQFKSVKNLYIFMLEELNDEPFLPYLAKFLSVKDVYHNLLALSEKGVKFNDLRSVEACRRVLEYVEINSALDTLSNSSKRSSTKTESFISIEGMIKNIVQFQTMNKKQPLNIHSLDHDNEKYVVCFNCCKSAGKRLLLCPLCCIVYFCSSTCNRKSMLLKNRHPCMILFYPENIKSTLMPDITNILEERLKWIKEQIQKRKLLKDLENKFSKEWNLIRGIKRNRSSSVSIIKKNIERKKFIDSKVRRYFENEGNKNFK